MPQAMESQKLDTTENVAHTVFHCIYIYHVFFICFSLNEHLGWFSILAIVNRAAVNTGVHVSF